MAAKMRPTRRIAESLFESPVIILIRLSKFYQVNEYYYKVDNVY